MTASTCDLFDAHPDIQSCDLPMRLFGRRRAFSGLIRTVRCREDNALVKSLLSSPGQGQVLVVDGGGSLHSALIGDLIAGLGLANGWAGAVVHGAIRDSVAIDALDFGIKALGTNPRRSAKAGAGEVDVTVGFGGVVFTPGHWLCSDEDGIVVAARPLG
ncbi:MAG: ribonuclease E activity regulator RraA [Burkholderiales bacterium]|jgi:regulator of ribonuclease activity A